MELAARKLVERYHYAVVFISLETQHPVRMRMNELVGIPAMMIRTADSFAKETYEVWRNQGGLLIVYYAYRHHIHIECDAMLFVECPLGYERFIKRIEGVRHEVVIYKPPSWHEHENSLYRMHPPAIVHRTIAATVTGLVGRELDDELKTALELSGFPPEETAVFRADDIMAITGVEEKQLRLVLKSKLFRSQYVRYHTYRPDIDPYDDLGEDPRWTYLKLLDDPDRHKGFRMLRFDRLGGDYIKGVSRHLKWLAIRNYITRGKCIYVVKRGFREPFYAAVDAVVNVVMGDWFKMRNIVEQSPEFEL